MLNIQKIPEHNAHEIIEEYLKRLPFSPIFFFSAYTLNTWLNHMGKTMYWVEYGGEKALVLYRERHHDVRFLFYHPTTELTEELKKHFDSNYIAANDVYNTNIEPNTENSELLTSIPPIANLEDSKIRKDYNAFLKKHPTFVFKKYAHDMKDDAFKFLDAWKLTRSELFNQYEKTVNDKHFLDLYSDNPNIGGGIVYDGETPVAITFFVPSMDGKVIGLVNKSLRGYTQLGAFVFVQRAKLAQERGYTEMYLGPINNDFKKRFLPYSKLLPTEAKLIYDNITPPVNSKYLDYFF